MRILVTGQNGFLMSNIIPLLKVNHDIVEFNPIQYSYNGYSGIDLILHFASPSDSYDFQNKLRMATSMVDLTQTMVHIANENKCKLVFASSMAAILMEDEYGIYKRAMEQYISACTEKYLILRIPRIYGPDKNKGLMKKIRLNEVPDEDLDNIIEYADILDFTNWFIDNLTNNGIEYYSGKIKQNTIKELKEIYCEF